MYMKAASAAQMREADKKAEEEYKISVGQLIENAAGAIFAECPRVGKAVVAVGLGNNGADGYAVARRLFLAGTDVKIVALGKAEHANALTAELLGIEICDFYERGECDAQLYIDAVFGTGMKRAAEGKAAEMIEWFNSQKGFKISVDIPSGVSADTGEILGTAVKADKTVTFAFAKPGLYLYPGKELSGEVSVKDISLPDTLGDTKKYIVNSVKLEKRQPNTHKGNYGHLMTLTGSASMAGAAFLSAEAAVKSGCGLVTAAVPDVIRDAVSSKLSEAMVLGLESEDGTFSKNALSGADEYLKKADILLIGCGIRNNANTAYLVREAINRFGGKRIVIDADGLNVLADSPEYFKGNVITPHPGEMARLLNISVASLEKDRMQNALSFADKYDCTVVLKGASTVTAYPDGRAYINCGGNPGMANGGSGDVLAGLTASFEAQKISEAAHKAVFVHSLAGDMAAKKYSENSMSATDIIKMIPEAIKSVYEER